MTNADAMRGLSRELRLWKRYRASENGKVDSVRKECNREIADIEAMMVKHRIPSDNR